MTQRDGLWTYFALAVGLTWALDLPIAAATLRGEEPGGLAILGAALSAWGPTIAAAVVAWRLGALRGVFGRWRTNPGWIVVALTLMPALHQVANALEVALGGRPSQWVYPPVTPEHVAALVMFSIGEEFGWRGFAYPRVAARWGPALGCVVLGLVWTAWHLVMWTTPDGPPTVSMVAWAAPELILGSVVYAWVFEKGDRSMAVAIALHMSAHLDNTFRAPPEELRLRVLRLVVLAVAAAVAARSLEGRSEAARAAG